MYVKKERYLYKVVVKIKESKRKKEHQHLSGFVCFYNCFCLEKTGEENRAKKKENHLFFFLNLSVYNFRFDVLQEKKQE